jgi:hypothetical protein
MKPDELEARRCKEEEKIAMAKSPKSRCCKVKGLPRGGLFDIGVYTSSDLTGSLFMS